MLTCHQYSPVAFIWEHLIRRSEDINQWNKNETCIFKRASRTPRGQRIETPMELRQWWVFTSHLKPQSNNLSMPWSGLIPLSKKDPWCKHFKIWYWLIFQVQVPCMYWMQIWSDLHLQMFKDLMIPSQYQTHLDSKQLKKYQQLYKNFVNYIQHIQSEHPRTKSSPKK